MQRVAAATAAEKRKAMNPQVEPAQGSTAEQPELTQGVLPAKLDEGREGSVTR